MSDNDMLVLICIVHCTMTNMVKMWGTFHPLYSDYIKCVTKTCVYLTCITNSAFFQLLRNIQEERGAYLDSPALVHRIIYCVKACEMMKKTKVTRAFFPCNGAMILWWGLLQLLANTTSCRQLRFSGQSRLLSLPFEENPVISMDTSGKWFCTCYMLMSVEKGAMNNLWNRPPSPSNIYCWLHLAPLLVPHIEVHRRHPPILS